MSPSPCRGCRVRCEFLPSIDSHSWDLDLACRGHARGFARDLKVCRLDLEPSALGVRNESFYSHLVLSLRITVAFLDGQSVLLLI
ncbi:hypothetical protein EUGRSUZ_B01938 [Eucalyptus grandis]|uniref:Uncharacterized protein n=2 Tax=Eucalyptus grandis TaxID=71139 RepID=A0ACC3LRV3_EUCGR|nr:hypothetical protein EUGRSUZ_B01938 [Eucalyptus grandis]